MLVRYNVGGKKGHLCAFTVSLPYVAARWKIMYSSLHRGSS